MFSRLWFGQLISNLCTQVSFYGFALWFFARSDQLGPYAAIALVVQCGRLFSVPLLRRWQHRMSVKRAMSLAYLLGGSVSTLIFIAFLFYGTLFPLWLLLLLLAIGSIAEAGLVMSFAILIPSLVHRDRLGRANGFFATTDGLVYLVAPYLGPLCTSRFGLAGVLTVDLLSFVIAFLLLVLGPWPSDISGPVHPNARANLGLRASSLKLLRQPNSSSLLVLGSVLMAGFAAAELLFPAWVLSALDSERLADAFVVSAISYAFGLALWQLLWAQRPGQWSRVFAAGLLVQGVVLTGALFQSAQSTVWLWFFGVAIFNCSVPPVLAAQQTLWHRWIPQERQPALFAARYAWDWTARLLTVALGGLPVDRWLAPVLVQLDWSLLGSGSGRALAVGLGIVGLVQLLVWLALAPGFSSSNEKLT